jgi:hypothetical protein
MHKLVFLLFPLICSLPARAQVKDDIWDVYMARYKDSVGSTVLDMSLKYIAPIKDLPFLVKTGIHFKGCSAEGLPKDDQVFATLHEVSDTTEAYMAGNFNCRLAGTFMYSCARTDYYYISDTTNVRNKLVEFYKHRFSNEQYIIEIRGDAHWSAYLDFLYPNEETQEYMRNTKVTMQLQKSGDNLVQPRQVDHWAYFANTKDREDFTNYITAKGFNVEETNKATSGVLPYSLKFSRVDKVDLDTISAITLELRRQAVKNNGNYDGWETSVIKQ